MTAWISRTLVAVMLWTGALTVIPATAAAASCTTPSTTSVSSPVSTSDFTYKVCGSAGVTISNGRVHDVLCDERNSYVAFEIQWRAGEGDWRSGGYAGNWGTTNGCGTWSTFPTVDLKPSARDQPTALHRLVVHLYAWHWWGGSSTRYVRDIHYYYY